MAAIDVLVQAGKGVGRVVSMTFSGGGRGPGRWVNYLGGGRDYVSGPAEPKRVHLRVELEAVPNMLAGPHSVYHVPDDANPTLHTLVCQFYIEEMSGTTLVEIDGLVLE